MLIFHYSFCDQQYYHCIDKYGNKVIDDDIYIEQTAPLQNTAPLPLFLPAPYYQVVLILIIIQGQL